jgi:2-beta-glucuronyltransferase
VRYQKILILTSHVFLPGYRKASVHFIAGKWAEQGHDVRIATVGYSWLSLLKNSAKFRKLRSRQNNRFEDVAPNLRAGAYLPPIHPFSSGRRLVNRLNRPAFRLFGGHLPDFIHRALMDADVVVIESGTPLAFFDYVKRHNPAARTLYFCRDLLRSVGAAPILQEIEARVISRFDAVCVPSKRLWNQLPAGARVRVISQGVDAALFDAEHPSPYPKGSVNAVSVGDMLFDEKAVAAMANAAPHVMFHIFGAPWHGVAHGNVVVHGERDFAEIVPYIVHADIGLAPYRLTQAEVYLAESSLKLAQYSYCKLPILLPEAVPFTGRNAIGYRSEGEADWRTKIDAALAMPRSDAIREGILTWEDVATQTISVATDNNLERRLKNAVPQEQPFDDAADRSPQGRGRPERRRATDVDALPSPGHQGPNDGAE